MVICRTHPLASTVRLLLVLAPLWGCAPGVEPVVESDQGRHDGGEPASCVDDRLGVGTADAPAASLGPGAYETLVVCAEVPDWFAIDAAADRAARVELQADDEITARLWRRTAGPAALVDEGVGRSVILSGVGEGLLLEVRGADIGYALRVRTTPLESPCVLGAGRVAVGQPAERALCLDGPDHVIATIESGRPATLSLAPSAESTVRVILWWPGVEADDWIRAEEVAIEPGSTGRISVIGPRDGAVRLTAAAERAAPGDRWRIDVQPEGEAPWTPCQITGRVEAWSRAVTLDGLEAPVATPATGARIDAVQAPTAGSGGALVGIGWVGDDGRVSLPAFTPPAGSISLRLGAAVRSEAGRDAASPVDGPLPVVVGPDGEAPWAEVLLELDADGCPGGQAVIEAPLDPDGPTAGAWAIARAAADGLNRVGALLPASPAPVVRYRWSPGFAADCGACFRPGPRPLIELSGRVSDPDQWDAAVVLHELGHYLAAVFSRDDSGGGPHDGSPIEPAIAWSEGFATFFAGWSLGAAVLLDYRVVGVRRTDLEVMDDPRAFGTADGTLTGPVSEHLVAAVLWDYHDHPAADDDPEALDDAVLFAPLFDALAGPWVDRGAPGVDLVDYLDALWCAEGPPVSVEPVVERGFPLDGPTTCRAKIGATAVDSGGPSPAAHARHGAWEALAR